MKILKVLALLACLLVPVAAHSAPEWPRDTTWTWSYDAPTDLVLSGFKMYQDGNPICEYSTPDVRVASCRVTLTKHVTSFTLTAIFADGQESPHSEAYVLNDWGPKPRIITVTPK